MVCREETYGAYTNIKIGYTYTDLNDYSYFYTLHDIENYYDMTLRTIMFMTVQNSPI